MENRSTCNIKKIKRQTDYTQLSMNVSADVDFVDFYFHSTAMGDEYWRFVEAVLMHMDGEEKREWTTHELHRRAKVLN